MTAVGHEVAVHTRPRPPANTNVVGEVVVTASWWWAACSCGWTGGEYDRWCSAADDAFAHQYPALPPESVDLNVIAEHMWDYSEEDDESKLYERREEYRAMATVLEYLRGRALEVQDRCDAGESVVALWEVVSNVIRLTGGSDA